MKIEQETKNKTYEGNIMKIIDVIKNRLGLKEGDLDKEMDIKTSQALESAFMEASSTLIEEKFAKEKMQKQSEAEDWAKNVVKANQKRREQNDVRKKLRHEKGISPSRRVLLKKRGKLQ